MRADNEGHLALGVEDGDHVDEIPEGDPVPPVVLDHSLSTATWEVTGGG